MPGRLEVIGRRPLVLVDGAHNAGRHDRAGSFPPRGVQRPRSAHRGVACCRAGIRQPCSNPCAPPVSSPWWLVRPIPIAPFPLRVVAEAASALGFEVTICGRPADAVGRRRQRRQRGRRGGCVRLALCRLRWPPRPRCRRRLTLARPATQPASAVGVWTHTCHLQARRRRARPGRRNRRPHRTTGLRLVAAELRTIEHAQARGTLRRARGQAVLRGVGGLHHPRAGAGHGRRRARRHVPHGPSG